MRKYTKKELRGFVRLGLATDISKVDFDLEFEKTLKFLEKVGYSCSTIGITGALFTDSRNGEMYVVIGRTANLYRLT